MTILKRASAQIENKILDKTRKVNEKYKIDMDNDLKVYLRLRQDGSLIFNQKGQVGMALLSDHELLQRITSGSVFSIDDEV